MTEEQIKQNAEAYADSIKEIRGKLDRCATRDDFIAGAHSRDEEIATLEGLLKIKEHEIKQLQNPWISVEERLPKDGEKVFTRSVLIIEGGGVRNKEEQYLTQIYICRWITDKTKQTNMCGVKYNIVDKVTHWMPIPQIEKGE